VKTTEMQKSLPSYCNGKLKAMVTVRIISYYASYKNMLPEWQERRWLAGTKSKNAVVGWEKTWIYVGMMLTAVWLTLPLSNHYTMIIILSDPLSSSTVLAHTNGSHQGIQTCKQYTEKFNHKVTFVFCRSRGSLWG